jgi:tetratricopeptide (TPR) repeat protein
MADPAPALGPRSFRLSVLGTLLALSFLSVAPALDGEVLAYDDQALLEGSEDSPGALHRSAPSFLTDTHYYAYLPVYGLTFWADGKLGATVEDPRLFHLQNVLWHAAASYVLFLLLGLLVGSRWGALAGAALFAVHPLHVESTAWIAGRKDVVSGFLVLAAWLLALLGERRRRLLLPALLLFLLACFAKASAVVLPLLLLAAILLLPRYRGRRAEEALWTLPFFLLAAAAGLVHLLVGVGAGVVSGARPLGLRLFGFVAAWGGAVERTLLPFDLSADYPEAEATKFAEALWPGLLLLLALLLFLAGRRRAPLAALGIAVFFLALAPFNNVFPSTAVLAADRYLYLPLVGAALAVAWAAARWSWGGVGAAAAALLCLALSAKSAGRFRSDEELWTRTIDARDGSALAWINRGLLRTTRGLVATPHDLGLLAEGVEDLDAGLARARLPEHRAKAASGLVIPLLELGRTAEALERADDALGAATGTSADARRFRASVHYNKGVVLKLGAEAHAAAAREFLASAKLRSRYVAWYEAGVACLRAGHVAEGREALARAAALDRTRPEPYLDLATLAKELGDRAAWKAALEEAQRCAPGSAEVAGAWVQYWLDDQAPNYVKAGEHVSGLPDSPAKRRLAAAVEAERALYLFRRGDPKGAVAAAEAARAGGLDDPRALEDLGQIYLEAARYDDAIACYRAARSGGDAVARALVLRAAALLRDGDEARALAAMREALEAGPAVLEAGAAPLRGEIEEVRRAGEPRLLLVAAAAVAGDAPLATRIITELIDAGLAPDDDRLLLRLRALVRAFCSHDLAGAEDDLRQLVKPEAPDPWARYRLAQVLTRRGLTDLQAGRRAEGEARLGEAEAILSAMIGELPGFHLARLARGEARFARGDLAGAKADYLALRERGAELKEVFLKEAVLHRLAYVQGGDVANLEAATNLLERALAEDPNYFEALFELGNVHHNLFDRGETGADARRWAFNRAALWYRRAMALNPRVAEPRLEWARLCLKAAREAVASRQLPQAHELLERVEHDAPDVAEAHRERASLLLDPEFGKATGMGPDEIFSRASRALEEIARLSPADPELPALKALYHRRRGWSFYLTWGKLFDPAHKARARELAVGEFTAAVRACPDDPENASIRDLLREIAPEVVALDEAEARKAFEAGRAAFDASRFADAAVAFRRAVLLFPESIELRYAYATALRKAGREDEAKDEMQLVANHADADQYPDVLYELGFYYYARDQELVGRAWLQRFVATMERLGKGDDPLVLRARQRLEAKGE